MCTHAAQCKEPECINLMAGHAMLAREPTVRLRKKEKHWEWRCEMLRHLPLVACHISEMTRILFFSFHRPAHLRRDEAMASEEGGQQVGSFRSARQLGDRSAQRGRQQRVLQATTGRTQVRVRNFAERQPKARRFGRIARIQGIRFGIQRRGGTR